MNYQCPTCHKPLDRDATAIRDYETVLARLAVKYPGDEFIAEVLNKHNPSRLSAEYVREMEVRDGRKATKWSKGNNPIVGMDV